MEILVVGEIFKSKDILKEMFKFKNIVGCTNRIFSFFAKIIKHQVANCFLQILLTIKSDKGPLILKVFKNMASDNLIKYLRY